METFFKHSLLALLCLASVGATVAQAQTPAPSGLAAPRRSTKYVPVNSSNAIRINYGYPAWNKDATKIDSASLIMREGVSGRLVQINLVETEPDSSVFSGIYSINWQNIQDLKVEFIVPPQDLLDKPDGLKKIAAMISDGRLKLKPFILRRSAAGAQALEIFDTRDQAQAALRAYRAEQQLLPGNTKIPSDKEVATAKLAEELQAKQAAVVAESDRMRLEQLEAARMADLKAKEAAMGAAERDQRRAKSAQLSGDGLRLYKENKFSEAVSQFEKAVELDPENRSTYFQYGIALYKINDFNKSLVYTRMADGPDVNKTERDFFIGLSHFKLHEYESATQAFERVEATKDADMSPAATFYRGVVQFENQQWDKARPAFQQVLDTSKDPQLDARAESYIEQILRIQQFELEKSRKWQLTATIGEQYDSNVLLFSDSTLSSDTASNTKGLRSLFAGSLRYRPVYEETREFAAQLDVLSMYTMTTGFKREDTLSDADPTVATLTLPWTYKGLAFEKGYKLDVTPGYETIFMSVEDHKTKNIISSILLNISNLFVMSNSLYSNFNLELRSDQTNLSSSVGDEDASAIKVKLINSNLHFLTDDKSKILTSEVAYSLNQARGKNSSYDRVDLAVGYIQPLPWELTGNAKLGYYLLQYPQRTDNRVDNDFTATLGASRKISEIYSAGLMANYNGNASNVEANTYKKWTALLTFSSLYSF